MKAEEYPEDQRNPRSAEALRSLAAWARENAAECEVVLGDLPPSLTCAGLDCLPLGEEASRLLSRYGFDYTEQPRTFLAELAKAAYQDELSAINVFTTGTRSSLGDPPPGRIRQIGVAVSRRRGRVVPSLTAPRCGSRVPAADVQRAQRAGQPRVGG
jgi:hypothetical protein